jgi:hypothetical protein
MGYGEDQDAREKLTAAYVGLGIGLAFIAVVAVISYFLAVSAH